MRCFIAIHLDDAIKSLLREAQSYFDGLAGKVSWTRREQMHLTIKFLGDVPDDRVERAGAILKTCAARVEPFEFSVGRLGCFPPTGRQVRILWVGVTGPAELVTLNDLLQQSYVELGYPAEKRKFAPHLTIGRVRFTENAAAYRDVIARYADFKAAVQQVAKITLYRSDLRSTGAVYSPIVSAGLGTGRSME